MYLVPNFRFNFSGVSREECQETLGPGVYDVDLVKGDGVNNFFAFLQFALGTLDKSGEQKNSESE